MRGITTESTMKDAEFEFCEESVTDDDHPLQTYSDRPIALGI